MGFVAFAVIAFLLSAFFGWNLRRGISDPHIFGLVFAANALAASLLGLVEQILVIDSAMSALIVLVIPPAMAHFGALAGYYAGGLYDQVAAQARMRQDADPDHD
ncbi:hypothetical protein [Novosphingobium sp.]|uniref:hypothetical protein n=1 Tax=Novosphingobium sp. TaxID=1874826 RepID=UPI00261CFC86|nr:hypothetical protein [Novosphingobium sp.]